MKALRYQGCIVQGQMVPLREHSSIIQAGRAQFQEGEIVDVTEEKHVRRRTLKQNARMWKLLGIFVDDWGWERDEAHDFCCEKFLDPVVHELPDGTRVQVRAGTKHLNVSEMSEFMDRIERWLTIDQGVHIPADGVK